MKKIDNLNDLLIEQGRELYDAVRQEELELNVLEKNAQNHELKQIIHHEMDKSKGQQKLLESTFKRLKVSPEGKRNLCCTSILGEIESLISRSGEAVRDAAVINGLQRLNHDKITGFGSLAAYLREIGEAELSDKFHNLVREERIIDSELSLLAEKSINKKARLAMAH